MATYYTQEGGQFHFHDDLVNTEGVLGQDGQPMREEKLVHSSKEVGIAYCQFPDRMHVFTHGTADGMKKWVEAHNAHSPHKAILKVFGQNTPAETLNKAIVDFEFFATLV